MMKSRNVIVHYHIFKNAGSSIDELLKRNFGDKWLSHDNNDAGAVITTSDLTRLIDEHAFCNAFSSHQIIPPIPEIRGTIYPIVFVRDPIDRLKSAFLFEWKKQLGLDHPKGTLREYVESKFVLRRRSAIEEFQTIRLSNIDPDGLVRSDSLEDCELYDRAFNFIKSLEFVGVVDQFDASCQLLKKYLEPAFPDFAIQNVQANVLQDITVDIASKRELVREELGADLFENVLERNKLDDRLYLDSCLHFKNLQKKNTIDGYKEAI